MPYPKSDIARFLISMIDTLSSRMAWYLIDDIKTTPFQKIAMEAISDVQDRIMLFSVGECGVKGAVGVRSPACCTVRGDKLCSKLLMFAMAFEALQLELL